MSAGEEPRRIAFLLSSLTFGGAERVTLNLADALAARGYVIDIVLMQASGELLDEARAKFRVVDLGCARTSRLPIRLARYLRRCRPVALISSFWKLNLCAALARVAAPDTKLALWEHSLPSRSPNSPAWLYAPSATLLYRAATVVVAVSDIVARDIGRLTIGLGSRLTTIYNAVPAPDVAPNATRRVSPHALVWVGRLDARKNPALMLEAFARLPRTKPYSLTIVGDGPLRAPLIARAAALGIDDRVRFTGFRQDPYAEMADAAILIVSSDSEGLSNVLIEGLRSGLSLVTTDCGAVTEVVEDGRYGTIVPCRDPAALATGIEREADHLRDPDDQRRGAERFDPATIAGRFVAALKL